VYNAAPIENFEVIEYIRSVYECMFYDQVPYGNDKVVKVPEIRKEDYQSDYLKEVLNIRKFVECDTNYIKDVIVHGSIATLDYVENWSDLDLMVILDEQALKTEYDYRSAKYEIENINDSILRFDKHQHHGAHVLIDKDLEMYPSVFLPIELWKDTKSLLRSGEYNFWSVPSCDLERKRLLSIQETFISAQKTGILHHHPAWEEYLQENFKNVNTMYQMKYFLSVVMLLPSLFMNLNDVYCEKKDSFELCRKHISPENYKIIDIASHVRSSFESKEASLINEIPDWVQQLLGKGYFKRAAALTKEMVEKCNITKM